VSDANELVKRLADSEVELQKCQSSCCELDDRVAALDAENSQLKAQLAVSTEQLDHVQHQLVEDRKVCTSSHSVSVLSNFFRLLMRIWGVKEC